MVLVIVFGTIVRLQVEQEIAASELSVVEQVLAADVSRTKLLAEERELWAAITLGADGDGDGDGDGTSAGGDEENDDDKEAAMAAAAERAGWTADVWTEKLARLAEVGQQLVASGADAAEAKVCRILSGLGFTRKMQAGNTTTLSGGWRMRVSLARVRQRCMLCIHP